MLIKQAWVRALLFFIAYVGVYFASGAAVGIVWALRHGLANANKLLNDPTLTMAVLLCSSISLIGVALLFRKLVDRQSIVSMGFAWKGHGHEAAAGVLLGLILPGAGSLILYATGHLDWLDTVFDARALGTGLLLFTLTAFSEEIAFRGYILNNLLQQQNKWVALAVSTLLFALIHLGNANLNPVAFLNLVAGGLLLGLNYVYTRNLWFSICFHLSWNFFQGPILGYEVSGLGLQSLWHMERQGGVLLTGGAFGFEGSIIATLLLALAIGLVWQRSWWKR
ncbi:CPBP family intramembrane glutamic endopeptidase [Paraflavitalea pollutisoli]|uniref:CPBP family intramembrane glutamic endopeptidase n=1 Tax=Paraflavitalea pollutisoli TaxID=3034143 RepID=UPI0023EAA410|nr:type II CAAX endopeptidase family protein [Paraflavitalea sp. H1-2-19X]